MTTLLWVLASVLVVLGLAGILLPAIPGAVLVFAGLLLAAWVDGFARVGPGTLILLGAIAAATYGVDFVAASLGVRRAGASPRAAVGAALGTLAGLFLGLPGVVLGPLVGAVLGEWSVHRDLRRAGRTGVAAGIGFVVGSAIKIALAFSMIGIFFAAMFLF